MEPTTWLAMPIDAHRYSRRMSSVTISPENVENVVSPPRNPVVTSSRASGESTAWRVMNSIAKPISRPPNRFAASVPNGSVGNTGLNRLPSPQRIHAPTAAPPPTARIPFQGMSPSPLIPQRRDQAFRFEQQVERSTDVFHDDVGGSHRLGGNACAAAHADPERRAGQHQAVVAAVADGDDMARSKAGDVARLGLRLAFGRKHDDFAVHAFELGARSSERVACNDVETQTIAESRQARSRVVLQRPIMRQRAVEIADEIPQIELPE